MKNNKGTILADVIAALFLLTLISLTVFTTISFQWKSVKSLELAETMDRIAKAELIYFKEGGNYTSKTIEDFDLEYRKEFIRNEFGIDFYLVELEIIHRSGIPRRTYEFITKE